MKKKILSSILAAAMTLSCSAMVMAEDKTPTVYVDANRIAFADQGPVILGEGTTLVPARGVFEAMGATVTWDGEKRLVEITSADSQTIIRLTIDDSTMRVYDMSGMLAALMMGQDFNAPETPVTLAVAPQIINDRTMIPLRAISEALNTEVNWDGENYRIDIATGTAPADTTALPALSLSASTDKVAAGETVDLYVNLANLAEGDLISGVSAAVKYNKASFEFVSATLVNGDTEIANALGASNPDYAENVLKVAFALSSYDVAANADGAVMKITFKSIDGSEGKFALENTYDSKIGYDTYVVTEDEAHTSTTHDGNAVVVDTTEVTLNGADATDTEEAATEETATEEAKTDDSATEATTEEAKTDDTATTETTTEETTTKEAKTSDSAVADDTAKTE